MAFLVALSLQFKIRAPFQLKFVWYDSSSSATVTIYFLVVYCSLNSSLITVFLSIPATGPTSCALLVCD
jgi:hypothetical protein